MTQYSKEEIIGLVQKIPKHPNNTDSKLHQVLTAYMVRHLEELGETITPEDIMLALSKASDDLRQQPPTETPKAGAV